MSLGTGYEYLLNSVARNDGATPAIGADAATVEAAGSSALTRYYAASGTPPGTWLGAGLTGLNDRQGVAEGSQVSERMLFNLLGNLADPVTGEPLGRRPRTWPTPLAERIRLRVGLLPDALSDAQRVDTVARIEAAEKQREKTITRPVAGFDLTFSVPKSVSVVWAVADADTQAVIYEAHREAIRIAVGYAERSIVFTRTGVNGAIQEEICGVIAAAFDHWDSRAGDPHLHTHVVIANRVQTVSDGVWRSVDSKTLFRYVVALSELHEGVLEDLLTDRLGYGWDERARRHSLIPRHDIEGVPDPLIEHFSQRASQIEAAKALLVAQFAHTHGRQPTTDEVLRLRQTATLSTRPDKQHRSLAEQTTEWRERARPFVSAHDGPDGGTVVWADSLRDRCTLPPLRNGDLETDLLRDAARIALDAVAAKRATFGHANVLAEVHRQLHGIRFATAADRLAIADRMTTSALDQALQLTPAADIAAPMPERLRRADDTSKLLHRGAAVFSTQRVLDAEVRLLDAGRTLTGPAIAPADVDEVVNEVAASGIAKTHRRLGADQLGVVKQIAGSGRVVDVLLGPAGTGKTASLATLRDAWEDSYGPGSVIGLAPSAAAAEVLGDELGIDTDNTAKWLHETALQPQREARIHSLIHTLRTSTSSPSTVLAQRLQAQINQLHAERERWTIHPGQLVIIDEASLAGTLHLDHIVAQAAAAGAKVVLVGDPMQLSAIDAGGAFAMLVADRDHPPQLSDVRRFSHPWEAQASLQLRVGDTAAIDAYRSHGRIQTGERDAMLDAVYTAWRDDTSRGLTSLMIAADRDAVAELNLRARTDRVLAGEVDPVAVDIASDGVAGVGDRIVTRENNRRLTTSAHSWVKNGDSWIIDTVGADGSLCVHRDHGHGTVTLPCSYVAQHVELGYATTAHRAQGRSVDTSHALIDTTTSREVLYVAATRGRHANTIYLNTADVDHDHAQRTDPVEPDVALAKILAKTEAERSAHTVLDRNRPQTDVMAFEPLPVVVRPSFAAAAASPTADRTAPGIHL